MTILPSLSPAPSHRETLYSYLARLASAWRTTAPELTYDMGAPFKRFLEHDDAAFEVLADWAKLDSETIEELLSWTGIRAGNVRMKFRGELYTSRALRNPVMRGCPVCLREDVIDADSPASSNMVMRGHWQMREANLCVKHGHPLVRLWEAATPRARFEMGARLREIEADILSGAFDQPTRNPSAYDLWLDQRLEDGSDDTWLKDHSVFAVTTLCRFLGEVLPSECVNDNAQGSGAIHAAGFTVIVNGKTAIRAALDQIVSRAAGSFYEPPMIFGNLYSRLKREYIGEESFDPFRDILRECIFANWPVAAGEDILGEALQSRRLHSLRTAAMETGIGAKSLIQNYSNDFSFLRDVV